MSKNIKIKKYEQHINEAENILNFNSNNYNDMNDEQYLSLKSLLFESKENLKNDILEISKMGLDEEYYFYKEKILVLIISISDLFSDVKFARTDKMLIDTNEELNSAQKKLESSKKELSQEEHKILTHVLTLLGVFTALITIILSTISATTSWLNKSDSADFASAILVPTTIILISMIAMFSLLYLMIFKKYNDEISYPKWKDFKAFWSIIFLFIICVTLLCFTTFNSRVKENKKYDNHRICSITSYRIDYNENKIYYIFNDLELSMEYSFDLIHEDGLHYCAEHKVFE